MLIMLIQSWKTEHDPYSKNVSKDKISKANLDYTVPNIIYVTRSGKGARAEY